MKRVILTMLLLLLTVTFYGQLSGVFSIPGGFPSIDSAFKALNTYGAGAAGVTFNVTAGYTETTTDSLILNTGGKPAGPIIFQKSGAGNNPVVTRNNAGSLATTVFGAQGDAIIILNGCDYVVFNAIDVSATTQGIEYGYYLIKANAGDGCKNVTITNCNITMNRGTSGLICGLYVSNNDLTTAVNNGTGIALISTTDGRNENIALTGNTISNVATGILLRGFNHNSTPYDLCDRNFTVGANGAGNTINNFAATALVPAAGIYIENHYSPNVSFNTINNAAGGGNNTAGTLYGIYFPSSGSPNGGDAVFGNNAITLGQAATAAAHGIYTNQECTSLTVSGNTFAYGTFASTTASYLIFANTLTPDVTVSYNSTTGTITKTGASGMLAGYYNQGLRSSGTEVISGNNFSNISLSGTSPFTGIHSVNGNGQNKNIYSNTVSGITTGSGQFYGIRVQNGATVNINQNTVETIMTSGAIIVIEGGRQTLATYNVFDNVIHGISTTGNASRITGIGATTDASSVKILNYNIYQNRIYDMTAMGATGTVWGIHGNYITDLRIFNNFISDLKAPSSSGTNPVQGINLLADVVNALVCYNTIYLNASSSGAIFGTTVFNANAAVILDLRNNLFVNRSNHNGSTGYTVVFRRSAPITTTNYLNSSNANNFFVASSSSILNYIHVDGTNKDSTIDAFRSRVAPCDAASFSEDPPFVNKTTPPYDLHLQATQTKCESSGVEVTVPFAISNDFDLQPRFPDPNCPNNQGSPATAPDVGADEFAGIPAFTCGTPNPGNTMASANNICQGDEVTLSLQNPSTGTGNLHQWQQSADGITFSDIPDANVSPYTVIPSAETYYRCVVTCQAGSLTATSVPLQVTFLHEVTSVTPADRCGTGTVKLFAEGDASLAWYATPANGTPLGYGSPFFTPVISANTTFYVGSETSAAQELTVGNGAMFASNFSNPFYASNSNSRNQHLIRAQEMYEAGFSAGNITTLGIEITNAGTLPMTDFSLKLANTAVQALSSFAPDAMTTVFTSPSFMPVPGTNRITFATPFYWDGSSNLLIEFCHGNPASIALMNRTCKTNTTTYYSTINTHMVDLPASGTAICDTVVSSYILTYLSRPMFIITGNTVCSSPRTAVIATVNPAPPFGITPDNTICHNAILPLAVISDPLPYDSFVWTPDNDLFTDPGATIPYTGGSTQAVYFRSMVAGTYTYTCQALNNTSFCANSDQVNITVLPANPQITATPPSVCISGYSILSLNLSSGTGAATFQWQQSGDGTNFSDISGATMLTYVTPWIGATTWYRVQVRDAAGTVCVAPQYELAVSNPVITGTTPGFHCGPGTVVLSATGTPGQIAWFDSPLGGSPLGTGSPFTTPYLWSTKTFYASVLEPGTILESAGRSAPASTENGVMGNYGMMFNASENIRLQSVDIYPIHQAGQLTVTLYNSELQIVAGPVSYSYPAGNGETPFSLPLDFQVNAGAGYRLILNAITNLGNLCRETLATAWLPWTYPMNSGTLLSITGAVSSIGGVPESGSYNWFYNWRVMKGCASPLIPVLATINLAPFYELTLPQAVCNNNATTLAVYNGTSYFDRFTWSPATYLFTDPACTVPYVANTSAINVYLKTTVAGNHQVRGYANNTVNGCTNFDTTFVAVMPASLDISADPDTVCISGSALLSLSPAIDYGVAQIQWSSSSDNINFTEIPGATTASYQTPNITATTYYKAVVKNSLSETCVSAQRVLFVDQPTVTGTIPGSRCGTGTVSLGATANPGSVIRWYDSPGSGMVLGTGGTFLTPAITATRNFYVTASSLSAPSYSLGVSEAGSTGTSSLQAGLVFDVYCQSMLLEGVYIYPVGTGEGSVAITLKNSANLVLETLDFACTGSAVPGTKTYLPLNWTILSGLDYYLEMSGCSGLVTSLVRDNSTSIIGGPISGNPACSVDNVARITVGRTNSGSSAAYYYFYDWKIRKSCSTDRIPVEATVYPGNPLNITSDRTVCLNQIQQIQALPPALNDYDVFTWNPSTDLYTDASATIPYVSQSNAPTVYYKSSQPVSTAYTCNAVNTQNQCNSSAQTMVTTIPDPVVHSLPQEICGTGSALLSLVPATGYGDATFQWQSSSDLLNYTDIPGATDATYQTGVLTTTSHFKVLILNSYGATCSGPLYTVAVNNPQLVSVAPASRCGPGTLTLGATPGPGSAINWYDAAVGGALIATGPTYITPVLNLTTSYFAAAAMGSVVQTIVPFSPAGTSGNYQTGTGWGLRFTVHSPVTIHTVKMYVKNSVVSPATIQVRITDLNDNVLYAGPVYFFTAGTAYTAHVVPVGLSIPPGNYKMVMTSAGINSLVRETAGVVYPYVAPNGELSITAGSNGAGTAQTTSAYFWFYEWNISSRCETPRQEVLASVTAAPTLTLTGNRTICLDEIYTLTVTSPPEQFESYTWSPAQDLFTNSAGTQPYIPGTNASTVYVRAQSGAVTTYTCSGTNSTGLMCSNSATVTVTTLPDASLTANPAAICFSGSATLSPDPPGGYGAATFQWQESADGTAFSDITGATDPTYATPVLTQHRYYKLRIRNEGGIVCSEPIYHLMISAPQVASTTPGSRCGIGSVLLSATAAGGSIEWYDVSTGGTLLGSGNAFSTPVISSSTLFYAAAVTSGSACASARTAVLATVTPPPAITVSASPETICSGNLSILSVTSQNANYTYLWTPGNLAGPSHSVYPVLTTNYSVSATDASSGCVNEGTVAVHVNPLPAVLSITPPSPSIQAGTIQSLTATGGTLGGNGVFGTSANINNTDEYPAPYTNYFGGTRHQMLIRAAELAAAGLYAGAEIFTVAFNVAATGPLFSGTLNNFQIDMGHTTESALGGSYFVSGLTTVSPAHAQTVAAGAVIHTLVTPFTWNGTDNIVIQTAYSNGNTGSANTAVQMYNSDPGYASTNWYRADNQTASAILAAPIPSGFGNARPNMILGFGTTTAITWTPVNDLYQDAAATVPYTGSPLTTVFAKPSATATYTAVSTASPSGCQRSAPVTVTVISSGPPPFDTITNITIGQGTVVCYDATNTLVIAGDGNNFQVNNGGIVNLVAGIRIRLLHGTRVLAGGYLYGYISAYEFCSDTKEGQIVGGEVETGTLPLSARFRIYPNPADGNFFVERNPANQTAAAFISVYDMNGKRLLEETMTGTKLEVPFTLRPSGLYYIRIISGTTVETIKLVKVR